MHQKSATNASATPTVVERSPPRYRVLLSSTLSLAIDQWFLFGIGLVILISSQAHVPLVHQELKTNVVNYLCVSIIFILTGLTLPTKVLVTNALRIWLHLFVQSFCFLLDSVTVFAVVSLIGTNAHFMDGGLMVGMIFMGSLCTTISSNVVMTRSAHGNEALTVVEATLGNILAPFLTPLLIKMYLASGAWWTRAVPPAASDLAALYPRVFKLLGLSMLLPLFVGQLLQNAFPRTVKRVLNPRYKIGKLSSVSLLVIIWSAYDKAFANRTFQSVPGSNMALVVVLSVAFYALWLVLSVIISRALGFNKRDTIAIAYCAPAKTPAMGVPLASAMFATLDGVTASKLQIPLVIFQGLQIAAGSLVTIPCRRWVRDEEEQEKLLKAQAEQASRDAEETKEQVPPEESAVLDSTQKS